jgi:hypothetical protein
MNLAKITCGLFITVALVAHGDDADRKLIKVPGQPVTVEWQDRAFQVYRYDGLVPFTTTLTLTSNNCTRRIGDKLNLTVPMAMTTLVALWTKHPRFQGKPVLHYESVDRKAEVNSLYDFVSSNSPFYMSTLQRIQAPAAKRVPFEKIAERPGTVAWMDCPKGCAKLLPKPSATMLTWDQVFEGSTFALGVSAMEYKTINLMDSRVTGMKAVSSANQIFLKFDADTNVLRADDQTFLLGVAYQLVWTFASPSLDEPGVQQCQMKWDVDFTQIFRQFTDAQNPLLEPRLFDSSKVSPYLYDPDDETRFHDMLDGDVSSEFVQ